MQLTALLRSRLCNTHLARHEQQRRLLEGRHQAQQPRRARRLRSIPPLLPVQQLRDNSKYFKCRQASHTTQELGTCPPAIESACAPGEGQIGTGICQANSDMLLSSPACLPEKPCIQHGTSDARARAPNRT